MAVTVHGQGGDNELLPPMVAPRRIILASDLVCFGDVTLNLTQMIRARYTPPQARGNGFDYDSASIEIEFAVPLPVTLGIDAGKITPFKIEIRGQAASAIQSYLTERCKQATGFRDILFGWINYLKGLTKKT